MNLTETQTNQIAEIFEEYLVPAGRELDRRGKTLFPRAPDPSASSYYIERQPTPASKQVFEVDVERFGEEMGRLWESQGLPELAKLAPMLASLAADLRQEAEPDDSVSPFIYVMF